MLDKLSLFFVLITVASQVDVRNACELEKKKKKLVTDLGSYQSIKFRSRWFDKVRHHTDVSPAHRVVSMRDNAASVEIN